MSVSQQVYESQVERIADLQQEIEQLQAELDSEQVGHLMTRNNFRIVADDLLGEIEQLRPLLPALRRLVEFTERRQPEDFIELAQARAAIAKAEDQS